MAGKKSVAAVPGDDLADLVSLEAVEPIRHNGHDVAPGEPLAMSAPQAEALLAMGAAKRIELPQA